MAKLLYIEASPRKTMSRSIDVARTFLDAYRAAHPADTIDTIDLWKHTLPEMDGATLSARYATMSGVAHDAEQAQAWVPVRAEAERFKAADKIVISSPMWNFGIPYKLKHYIDIVTQMGITVSFVPEKGYVGLVTGKPVALILASAGEYQPGSGAAAIDFQKPYLDWILKFWGVTQAHTIRVWPMAAPDKAVVEKAIATAKAEAIALAKVF